METAGAASTPAVQVGQFHGRDLIVQFGLLATPASFQARVKRFLNDYLGSAEEPVPFGGRRKQLGTLNNWLRDPAAKRNFLLTAPAGRGKTALLVRWISQLDETWPVCFVPISIRYETNRAGLFYQALASRLSGLLNVTLPQTPADAADFYKEKTLEYLDQFSADKRCLLVIDGLDEAAGWRLDTSVLPLRPQEGLRVVASARQLAGDKGPEDWLRRLGWARSRGAAESMQVPPLNRDEIQDVLHEMGFPLRELSQDVDIVKELHRLTDGGDPLLLNFYVKDLWEDLRGQGAQQARLKPQDLRKKEPGFRAYFGDYFRDWLDEQKAVWRESEEKFDKDVIDASLLLLSCALGPVKLNVLGGMIQRLLGKTLLIGKQTLEPIGRFVIGEGVETGYAFTHPKLATFIQEDYIGKSTSVENANRAIVEWCRSQVNELSANRIPPSEFPEYALLYYVQHLDQLQHGADLIAYRELLEQSWLLAWQAHSEGLRGLARDWQAVWNRLFAAAESNSDALRQPKTGIGGLIRCLLLLSSIRSVGSAVPANFMAQLVAQGIISAKQALHLARQKEERQQAETLQALALYLDESELDEALTDAEAFELERQAETIAKLAAAVGEPRRSELFSRATGVAQPLEENKRAAVLDRIEKWRNPPQPSETTSSFEKTETAATEYASLLPEVPSPPSTVMPDIEEQFHEALETFAATNNPWLLQYSLEALGRFLSEPMLETALERLFVSTADNLSSTNRGLAALAPFLSRRLIELALEKLSAWARDDLWLLFRDAFEGLAPYAWRAAREKTFQFALDCADERIQALALATLLPLLNEAELERAFESATKWRAEYTTREAFGALVAALPASLLDKGLAAVLARGETDPIARILPRLPQPLFLKALQDIRALNSYWQKEILSSAARVLSPDQIRLLLQAVGDDIELIDAILPSMPDSERKATASSAYKSAVRVGDGVALSAAMVALANRLPEHQARTAIELSERSLKKVAARQERAFGFVVLSCWRSAPEASRKAYVEEAKAEEAQVASENDREFVDCMIALSPAAGTEDIERIHEGFVTAGTNEDSKTLFGIILLFSPHTTESMLKDVVEQYPPFVRNLKPEDRAAAGLIASMSPRLPGSAAMGMSETNDTQVGSEILRHVLSALSPRNSVQEAKSATVRVLAEPNGEEAAVAAAFLAPYLPDDETRKAVLKSLASCNRASRSIVLGVLCLLEGDWLDLFAIKPALSGGKGAQGCLQRIGGEHAVAEAYAAVRDSIEWWP